MLSENKNKEKIRSAAKEIQEQVIEECNKIIEAIEMKMNSDLSDLKEESRKMVTIFNHKIEAIESRMTKNQLLLEQCQTLLNEPSSFNNELTNFYQKSASFSTEIEKDMAVFYNLENNESDKWRDNICYLVQPSKTCSDYEIAHLLFSLPLSHFDSQSLNILFYQNNKLLIGKSSTENLIMFHVADKSMRTVHVPKLKSAVLLKSTDIADVNDNTFSVTSQKSNLLYEKKFKGPLNLCLHNDDILYLLDNSTHYVHQSSDNGRTWTKLFRISTEGLCSRLIVLSDDDENDKQRFWMIEGRPSVSSCQLIEYLVKGCSGKQRLTKVKIHLSALIIN